MNPRNKTSKEIGSVFRSVQVFAEAAAALKKVSWSAHQTTADKSNEVTAADKQTLRDLHKQPKEGVCELTELY